MNDWSARDVQKDEMACWLGPAKAKDFATTLGPWLVTPDEWSPEDPHEMTVTVDGEVWSRGTTSGRRWSFAEMLAWVSRDEDLWPTDVLGSGTFGGGCGLDLDRWLVHGQTVTLTVEGLGSLTSTVGTKA
jgi:2-keto-4-pentenoate hydratase/2-oxohepta-3-ene-1,7-dioic acid hydratase in catechol pathway